MLQTLGLPAQAEEVYRALLTHPGMGVPELADRMKLTETQLRESLDVLVDLALLNPSWLCDGTLRLVSPRIAPAGEQSGPPGTRIGPASTQTALASTRAELSNVLVQAEAEIAVRQRQIEATRAAIAAVAAHHDSMRDRADTIRYSNVDAVLGRLAELAQAASKECLWLTPDMSPPQASAVKRAVSIRAVCQEGSPTAGLGGQIRTLPLVPIKLFIIDSRVALLGEWEVRSPGTLAALRQLFEQMWSQATPHASLADDLDATRRELIKLLGGGQTDEAASRRLGISVRTVRRLMAGLAQQLGASSRFQAGAEAVRRGWL
ncbi:MAG TPA: hypothetical protein VF062_15630 [Candidatus Limnocylindrales bacterium]